MGSGESGWVSIPSSGISVTASSGGNIYIGFGAYTSSTWGASNTLSLTVGTVTNNSAFSITNRTAPPFASPTPFIGTSTSATQILTFNYTATHTRTYTVTATGFDCRLSLNNSEYQDEDIAPGKGEIRTIDLTAGASLAIYVTGAVGSNLATFGTITVNIT
jgi:hypothetical protein